MLIPTCILKIWQGTSVHWGGCAFIFWRISQSSSTLSLNVSAGLCLAFSAAIAPGPLEAAWCLQVPLSTGD